MTPPSSAARVSGTTTGPGTIARCGRIVAYSPADRRRAVRPLQLLYCSRGSLSSLYWRDRMRHDRTARPHIAPAPLDITTLRAREPAQPIRATAALAQLVSCSCISPATLAGRRPISRSSPPSRHSPKQAHTSLSRRSRVLDTTRRSRAWSLCRHASTLVSPPAFDTFRRVCFVSGNRTHHAVAFPS